MALVIGGAILGLVVGFAIRLLAPHGATTGRVSEGPR